MRPSRPTLAVSAVAAWITLTATCAFADPLASVVTAPTLGPWSLAPGEYYAEISGSTFKSSSWFGDDGKRTALGSLYSERRMRSSIEMGWKKRLSFQMSLPFVTATDRLPGGYAQSITGLEDIGFGLRYKLMNGSHAAAIQVRWETPTGYNRKLALAVGDGLQKLSGSLQLGGAAGKGGFWQAGVGYRYDFLVAGARSLDPADGAASMNWSDHLTWNAAFARWLGRVQVAGIFGADVPQLTGRSYTTKLMAVGPRLTYRADDRLDVFGGSWHCPSGKNSLKADEVYVGVAWKATKLDRIQGFLGSDKHR